MSYEQRRDLGQDGAEHFEPINAKDPEIITQEQIRKDQEEQLFENGPYIETPALREKLTEAKKTEVEKLITKALKDKPDGTDEYKSVKPEHFDQEIKHRKKVTGFKKLAMSLGFIFAGMAGAKAGNKEVSRDTSDTKRQTIRNIERSETVDNTLRQDWNDYIDWLEMKGFKGSAVLDHGGKGMEMIRKYQKEYPSTTISPESIDDIQAEFIKYRNWALKEIKAGRGTFAPGTNEENFMKNLSKEDMIPGQLTTRWKFPLSTTYHLSAGELNSTEVGTKASASNNIESEIKNISMVNKKVTKIEKDFAKTPQEKRNDNLARK